VAAVEPSSPLGVPGLSAQTEQVYLFVVHHGRVLPEDVAERFGMDRAAAYAVLDELRDVGLIALPEVPDGVYTPVDPQFALGAVVSRLDEQASGLRNRIPALAEDFRRSVLATAGTPPSLVMTDPGEVAQWYARLQHQARREMLTFDRPPYVSLGMEPLEATTISRGVSWRVVYAAASFERAGAWEETARMADQGEQARVAPSLPIKLVVVDRSIALVALRLDGTSVETMVTESPPLVALLVETFEAYWARALPIGAAADTTGDGLRRLLDEAGPEGEGAPARSVAGERGGLATREQQAILALIGTGLTDEAIAARLGLSVRSLRRRTQALMSALGAENRFQLGVEAARRGWV